MVTKARKTSKGVRVSLDTMPGQTLTCVVPHDQVEKARELYFAYREAEACGSHVAGWLGHFLERSLTARDRLASGDNLRALHLGEEAETAFVEAFKHRFERGL